MSTVTQRKTAPKAASQDRTSTKEKPFIIENFLDLDPAHFTFLTPKKNAHGGYIIPIRYKGKSLYVTYEARTCPFGISESTDEKTEYRGKYPPGRKPGCGKKVTGYTTSISFHKEYEQDPYFQKAVELDDFFMNKCHENAIPWNLGGTAKNPLSREAVEGYDERGADGKWKRFVKWAYKKDEKTNERVYQDYAPRMEFGVPTVSTSETPGADGLLVQEAIFKPVFFDMEANKLGQVSSMDIKEILPNWSKIALLAQWASITQGTYGASVKPKVQQFRVFPSESLATDECLLNDPDEEEETHDLPDQFGGEVTVTRINAKAAPVKGTPAPLDTGVQMMGDEGEDVGGDDGEDVQVDEPVAPPAPAPVTVATRPQRRAVRTVAART